MIIGELRVLLMRLQTVIYDSLRKRYRLRSPIYDNLRMICFRKLPKVKLELMNCIVTCILQKLCLVRQFFWAKLELFARNSTPSLKRTQLAYPKTSYPLYNMAVSHLFKGSEAPAVRKGLRDSGARKRFKGPKKVEKATQNVVKLFRRGEQNK